MSSKYRSRMLPMSPSTAAIESPLNPLAALSMPLPGGMKLAGLAHHLVDLGDMLLLEGDLFTGVLLKPHALVHHEREQVVVLAKCGALVIQRFTQNLRDVMFVGFHQLADVGGRMPAKGRDMFAGHCGVVHALRGLVAHPADDRNARVAEDHQRVMEVAHHASELELQNGFGAA